MGDPQVQRISQDAQTQKENHIAQVLWVSCETIGSGFDKAVWHSRCVDYSQVSDPPDKQWTSCYAKGDPDQKAQGVWEDPAVPIQEDDQGVQSKYKIKQNPGQLILPGGFSRWGPDPFNHPKL